MEPPNAGPNHPRRDSGRRGLRIALWTIAAGLWVWASLQRHRLHRPDSNPRPAEGGPPVVASTSATAGRSEGTDREPGEGVPSAEVLRARAIVAQLTRELAAAQGGPATSNPGSPAPPDELDHLMKGRRPSEFPDFVTAESLRNRGFASPDAALETYWWSFSGPDRQRDLGDLWWSPSGSAGDGYHFEVFLGQGVGSLLGYRIAGREQVSPDEVLYRIQREERAGVIEEEARFVRTETGWKRMPEVRRVKDAPPP